MQLIRPVAESDLPGVVALARSIGGGLTTLPPDESFLRDRIDDSLRAFSPRVKKPGGEFYLFVLEDLASGELLGTSGIAARVGGYDPFYSYQIRTEHFVHAPLKVEKTVQVLHLKEAHRGPTELCSLFLRADGRRGGLGRLLSLSRFLFIASHRPRFDETIIAELRGYIDQQGKSPFWEAVGRHFFEGDFYAADLLSGLGNKEFIADLMPDHPIYVSLLPASVQATIGRVHHETEAALALLRAEGFSSTDEVDIFDAGPQVRASVGEVRTIRHARRLRLRGIGTEAAKAADTTETPEALHLLANGRLEFRACLGTVDEEADGTARLTADVARALSVQEGDDFWVSPAR